MSSKARIEITFIEQPTSWQEVSFNIKEKDTGTIVQSFTESAIELQETRPANRFFIGNFIQETYAHLTQAIEEDYPDASITLGSTSTGIYIESDLYNRSFEYTGSTTNTRINIVDEVITPEDPPVEPFDIENFAVLANDCNSIKVQFTPDSTAVYPIQVTSPVAATFSAPPTTGEYHEITANRYDSPQATLKVVDAESKEGTELIPRVDTWEIDGVEVDILAGVASATINAPNINTGEIHPTKEYSLNDIDWQSSNQFTNIGSGLRRAYVRDNYGCKQTLDFQVNAMTLRRDNFIGECTLLAAHNPLIQLIDFTHGTETAPPWLSVFVAVDGVTVGSFRAYALGSVTTETRRYMFVIDEIIRGYLPEFSDYRETTEGVFQPTKNTHSYIKLDISTDLYSDSISFVAANAARQFGNNGPTMLDVYNNQIEEFIFIQGQPGYAYVYDKFSQDFYRKKSTKTSTGQFFEGYSGNIAFGRTLPYCAGERIVKYLDKNGMYRFYKFNPKWEVSDKPKLLGKTSSVITSILDTGNTKVVGYQNERTVKLQADNVPKKDLIRLSDINTSPRVYLHIGEHGSDGVGDWVECEVSGNNIVTPRNEFTNIQIELTLPEHFSVSMI